MNKIAIIGGGAAGLAAACAIGNVTVYERNERVGKKLLQTGNGRCNLLNTNLSAEHLQTADTNMLQAILGGSPVSEITTFFENMGLLMRTESEGRVYPLCNQAAAVLDILRYTAAENGARIKCGVKICEIRRKGSGFELISEEGVREYADKVILACGGRAAPKTGSDGNGYTLARRLGHSVTELTPALVALKVSGGFCIPLKGIRCKAAIKLAKNRKIIAQEVGEIQFTDYGISGIAAMQLSRLLSDGCAVMLDLAEEYNEEYLLHRIREARAKHREAQDLLLGIVQRRVAQQIVKNALGISPSMPSDALREEQLARLASAVKSTSLNISGSLSWDNAQVTSGGVPLSELDATMESKKCRGLYIIGEMSDCDGECGGYNLGWAWITALRAAEAIKKQGEIV